MKWSPWNILAGGAVAIAAIVALNADLRSLIWYGAQGDPTRPKPVEKPAAAAPEPEPEQPKRRRQFQYDPACYGETFEAYMTYPGALFSWPIAFRPYLEAPRQFKNDPGEFNATPSDRQLEWNAICHPEPVEIESFYGGNFIGGYMEALGLTEDGPRPKRYSVRGGKIGSYLVGQAGQIKLAVETYEGLPKKTKDGFDFYGPPNGNGIYVAPESYVDGEGDRIGMRCIFAKPNNPDSWGECSVDTDVRGVGISYWFDPEKFPLSEWFELDRRMRRAMDMIITKGPDE